MSKWQLAEMTHDRYDTENALVTIYEVKMSNRGNDYRARLT
jgi:hypothetical protein